MISWRILHGDVRAMLATLPENSAQCCVTSPPYWGLRDYGVDGQIGIENTPDEFVAVMVDVFRGVRRVLRDDGVLWLNLGDSYAYPSIERQGPGLKAKDLCGIPWRVALALQADGWWLRSDCIWHKPNPMPESITDRPTKGHEYVFLLTKSASYFWDVQAVRQPYAPSSIPQRGSAYEGTATKGYADAEVQNPSDVKRRVIESMERNGGANMRTVWTIPTQPYSGAHFATFPEELARRCIVAGSRAGDTVLDPFCGSGTTGSVAVGHGRSFVGIELNPAYIKMARKRIGETAPLLAKEHHD